MKKYIYIITTCLLLSACNGFLQRDPIAKIGTENYFTDEESLNLYLNGFINSYTPSPEDCAFGDGYSDIVVTAKSTAYLTDPWSASLQGGWTSGSWKALYNINYFLKRFKEAKCPDEKTYAHYEGTAKFWRAWFYFKKVKTFGAVPYYTEPINPDDKEKLYKERDNREIVMDHVLEDLNYACENLSTNTKWLNNGQINKYIALAFKSRVCLFEGTYRKYHKVDPSTGEAWKDAGASKRFLEEAADAAKKLMDTKAYSLVDEDSNKETQYRAMFTNEKLNHKEVLWGVECNVGMSQFNELTWKFTSGSYGERWSLDQDFVQTYLNTDGSRHTAKNEPFPDEVKNRDLRLKQTIITPGYKKIVGDKVVSTAPKFSITLTGYQIIKFNLDDSKYESSKTAYNSLPIIRYAEVLLNYAEAMAELGQFNSQIWDSTIKLLRKRAGVDGARPATADPVLAEYYKISDTDLLEIRRERAIELIMEGFRYDDLMRWHLGNLLNKKWFGIYVPEMDKPMDLDNDGKYDFCFSSKKKGSASGVSYILPKDGFALENGKNGRLIYNVTRIFDEQRYLRPIPKVAIDMNSNLKQNAAWAK